MRSASKGLSTAQAITGREGTSMTVARWSHAPAGFDDVPQETPRTTLHDCEGELHKRAEHVNRAHLIPEDSLDRGEGDDLWSTERRDQPCWRYGDKPSANAAVRLGQVQRPLRTQ